MPRHSQRLIYPLKAYPQFSQGSEPSFQEIHNFHKQESHTCKKSAYKAFLDFQNQFLNLQCLDFVFKLVIQPF